MVKFGKRKNPFVTPTSNVKKRSLVKSAAKFAVRNVPYAGLAMDAAALGAKLLQRPAKKRVPRAKGQSYRYGGKISRGRRKGTVFDRVAEKGFVKRIQCGNVMTSQRAVGYLAQSDAPVREVVEVFAKALAKKLLEGAGIRLKNDQETILNGQYYGSTVELRYKEKDGGVIQTKEWNITSTTTLEQLAGQNNPGIAYWLLYTVAGQSTLPTQMLTLRYYVEFGTLGTARLIQSEIDLTGVTVTLDCHSQLKMQNRTVNSASNNEADDVDNVPLDGKFYDFSSNGTQYKDYNEPTAAGGAIVTTHPNYGILPTTLPVETGSLMFKDVPLKSQFIGCKKNGNWKIQPASIKTSDIRSHMRMSLQKFISTALTKVTAGTSTGFQQFWLGKTRIFAFEKMIMASIASEVNQITMAFDHEINIGCSLYVRYSRHTAPAVANFPAVTA